MDHLPLPKNPRLDPVVIRYHCAEPYDGGPALSYPARHDWEVLYSPWGINYLYKGKEADLSLIEGFLQNWLYFGLIHEVFGDDINLGDFVKVRDDGSKVVTTEPLEAAVAKLSARLKLMTEWPEQDQKEATAPIWTLLGHTWLVSANTIARYDKSKVDERLWVSIAVVGECLESVVYNVFLHGSPSTYRIPGNPPLGKFLVEEMSSKGWCPFDVARVDYTSRSVSALYYLSNMEPPRADLDHSACNKDLCVWMSIGSTYRSKHMTPNCTCGGFGDVAEVISVLEGEGIPLIQAKKQSTETEMPTDFQIVDSDNGVEFIAISHVWAEGLGNPHENALPPCSLVWVSNLVQGFHDVSSSEAMPFWVDTVCVPIKPKEMHTVAMNRLRHPYQKAQAVLVLDSYLYTQDSTKISLREIWCRVVLCSWSQRLWTFQEGRLAKSLWFQFADRALRLEDVWLAMDEPEAARALSEGTLLAYRGHNVISDYEPSFRPEPDIRDMRESLKSRAVSVASDEALCVFATMFLDLELVTSLPPQERMPMFWKTVKQVPIGVIFSTTPRKLTMPGLHWAPESFMGDLDTPHWLIEQMPKKNGHYNPHGLRMNICGYLLDPGLLIWDDSFDTIFSDAQCRLRDEDGIWYFTELGKPWNPARKDFPGENEKLAILLITPLKGQNRAAGDDPFNFMPGKQAIIGTVQGYGDDGIPKFKGYRHMMLHEDPPAIKALFDSVYGTVERYVEETCQRQLLESISLNDGPEAQKEIPETPETPETFALTNERRVEVQKQGEEFARTNPVARRLALAHGRINGRGEDSSIEQYGFHCRFQLQMRLRNRIRSFPPTTTWYID